MRFVRIRYQYQWVSPLQFPQKILRNERLWHEYRRPRHAELGQRHVERCPFTQVSVKFLSRDLATLVPAYENLVPEDRFELLARNRAGLVECLYYGFKAEIDQNFTEVKQEGLNLHS
jgi:hypothetical protein